MAKSLTAPYALKPWPTKLDINADILSSFTRSFVEAGLSLVESGTELAKKKSTDLEIDGIPPVIQECMRFLEDALRRGLLSINYPATIKEAGKDFWFSRNGDTKGFSNRKKLYGEYASKELQASAERYKKTTLVVNTKGKVLVEGLGITPIPEYAEVMCDHRGRIFKRRFSRGW